MKAVKSSVKDLIKSKFFIILAAVAVFLTVVPSILALMGRQDLLRSAANLIATPFKAAAKWCGDGVNGFVEYFTEFDRLKEENQLLKELLEEEKEKNQSANVAMEENEWLRAFLLYAGDEQKPTLIDVMANGRDAGDGITSYTLNKGSLSGVSAGMAVISDKGLIGYISEVGLSYSKVTTILSEGAAVGAICPRSGSFGTLESSYSFSADGLCRMICPDPEADIKEGDLIVTSGAGSVYPFGIAIGHVISTGKDAYSRKTLAVIEPLADLDSVNRVMIISVPDEEVAANE